MSTNQQTRHDDVLQNRFGLRVAARLSAATEDIDHDIQQRLKAARARALESRKKPVAATQHTILPIRNVFVRGQGMAPKSTTDDTLGFWGRLASAALVVVLAAGLVTINIWQEDGRTTEIADLDADLLTDDLPPRAYADPGFLQFLKDQTGEHPSTTQ